MLISRCRMAVKDIALIQVESHIYYHGFILTRLKRGLDTRQIVDDIADLYSGSVLNVDSRGREKHDPFLRSMLMAIVVGYETYFERSGQLS